MSFADAQRLRRREVATTGSRPLSRALLRLVVAGLFFITLFLSIALVKWGVAGLPFRAFLGVGIIGLTLVTAPRIIVNAIRDFRLILLTVIFAAAVGVISSMLNNAELSVVLRQVLEIHVQALIGVIVGACVLAFCGPQLMLLCLVAAVGISAMFALLQFLGIDAAWQVRATLQAMQPVDGAAQESVWVLLKERAVGLSYSPVLFGSQLCLTFAAAVALFARTRPIPAQAFDKRIFVAAAALSFFALVTGNRSPLMGIAAAMALYVFLTRPKIGILLALFSLPLLLASDDLSEMAAGTGLRAAQARDGSANNREVLRAFGLLLLWEQPYGYGLSFNSIEHAWRFWPRLMDYELADRIFTYALHNYYLMILDKYGVVAFAVFVFAADRLRRSYVVLIAFIPYLVHIYFHNDGPLQADFIIWFIVPLFLVFYRSASANYRFVARLQRPPMGLRSARWQQRRIQPGASAKGR